MQFLSLSRRRVDAFPPEAFAPELMARETQRVKALYSAGLLRQIWRRHDVPGAAILWEAADEAEVRSTPCPSIRPGCWKSCSLFR
jgi:muconolactone delta-isomerase